MEVDMAAVAFWVLVPMALFLILFVIVHGFIRNPMSVTREAALDALSHLETWANWMAGIETAVVGGLVALLFKHEAATDPSLSFYEKSLAFGVFVAMGLALFCSAWILSSLPSQALRLDPQPGVPGIQNDIYENTLYGWMA